MGAAGTEGGGGGRAAGGVFGCEGSAVATTDAEEEGTGAGLLGGAAVWTTLGLALREKRDRERQREVREGGGY
jgi:hypothetical protein